MLRWLPRFRSGAPAAATGARPGSFLEAFGWNDTEAIQLGQGQAIRTGVKISVFSLNGTHGLGFNDTDAVINYDAA